VHTRTQDIQYFDDVTTGDEIVRQMGTDETRPARDQNPHDRDSPDSCNLPVATNPNRMCALGVSLALGQRVACGM
jgi:hypothetical protein